MKKPTLSIVIPAFNASTTIRTITSSILAETFTDFELLLVDDGSTDDTLKILGQIKDSDPRVVVIGKSNGGPSSARNAGIAAAQGEYLLFRDADDDIQAGSLDIIANSLVDNDCDMLVTGWQVNLNTARGLIKGYKRISPSPQIILTDIKKFVVASIGNSGELYNLWNKVFKTDIIKSKGIRFREDLNFGEDLVFAFHYLNHVRSIQLISDITYHYLAESNTSVFSKSALVLEHRKANLEELDAFTTDVVDAELNDLTEWVKWRWMLSFQLVVSRSGLPTRQKLRLFKEISQIKPKIAKSRKFIGLKKLLIEHLLNVIRRSPITNLLFVYIVNFIKYLIRSGKSIALNGVKNNEKK